MDTDENGQKKIVVRVSRPAVSLRDTAQPLTCHPAGWILYRAANRRLVWYDDNRWNYDF